MGLMDLLEAGAAYGAGRAKAKKTYRDVLFEQDLARRKAAEEARQTLDLHRQKSEVDVGIYQRQSDIDFEKARKLAKLKQDEIDANDFINKQIAAGYSPRDAARHLKAFHPGRFDFIDENTLPEGMPPGLDQKRQIEENRIEAKLKELEQAGEIARMRDTTTREVAGGRNRTAVDVANIGAGSRVEVAKIGAETADENRQWAREKFEKDAALEWARLDETAKHHRATEATARFGLSVDIWKAILAARSRGGVSPSQLQTLRLKPAEAFLRADQQQRIETWRKIAMDTGVELVPGAREKARANLDLALRNAESVKQAEIQKLEGSLNPYADFAPPAGVQSLPPLPANGFPPATGGPGPLPPLFAAPPIGGRPTPLPTLPPPRMLPAHRPTGMAPARRSRPAAKKTAPKATPKKVYRKAERATF